MKVARRRKRKYETSLDRQGMLSTSDCLIYITSCVLQTMQKKISNTVNRIIY